MALCSTCGQQTEPDADLCLTCGRALDENETSLPAWQPRYPGSEAVGSAGPMTAAALKVRPPTEPAEPQPAPMRSLMAAPSPTGSSPDLAALQTASKPIPDGPRDGRFIALAVAAVVVIIAAAAALLVLGHYRAPASNRAAGAAHSVRPTGRAGSPLLAPGLGNSTVAVLQGAATQPHVTAVVSFLTRYFTAINSHDYQAYQRLFSSSVRSQLSAAAFGSGYGSTTDSRAVLRNISAVGLGRLAVLISFTSHQQPAGSVTDSSCTTWSIVLYLARQGHKYVLQSPPSNYQASATSCS